MMKSNLFQITQKNNAIQTFRNITTEAIMIKKYWLKKATVAVISASFVFFNASVSYAQITTPSTDTDTPTDTSTDTTTTDTTTTDTGTTDSTTDSTTDLPVVELIENTDSEQVEPEAPVEETSSGGGGSSAGIILGLAAVGAIVAVVLTRKKSPKIQKTLVSDKISGFGTEFVELSTQSSLLEKSAEPQLSFQYGSYQQQTGFNQPYSFFNVRASQDLGANLSFRADAGTRLFFQNNDDAASSQWLTLSMQSRNLFQKNDSLEFFAKYSVGDDDQRGTNLLSNGLALQDYETLFSDENARFELAYSRSLSQNQRLRFLLQKTGSSQTSDDDGYLAKVAWKHAF